MPSSPHTIATQAYLAVPIEAIWALCASLGLERWTLERDGHKSWVVQPPEGDPTPLLYTAPYRAQVGKFMHWRYVQSLGGQLESSGCLSSRGFAIWLNRHQQELRGNQTAQRNVGW